MWLPACRDVEQTLQIDGLMQVVVDLSRLYDTCWAISPRQRHWQAEDEYVHGLEGELTLIEDDDERVRRPAVSNYLKCRRRLIQVAIDLALRGRRFGTPHSP